MAAEKIVLKADGPFHRRGTARRAPTIARVANVTQITSAQRMAALAAAQLTLDQQMALGDPAATEPLTPEQQREALNAARLTPEQQQAALTALLAHLTPEQQQTILARPQTHEESQS